MTMIKMVSHIAAVVKLRVHKNRLRISLWVLCLSCVSAALRTKTATVDLEDIFTGWLIGALVGLFLGLILSK